MTEKRFSIRLANGNEQTFDSARQLASWTRSQYALQKMPAPVKRYRRRKQRVHRKVQAADGGLPLSKYFRQQGCVAVTSE